MTKRISSKGCLSLFLVAIVITIGIFLESTRKNAKSNKVVNTVAFEYQYSIGEVEGDSNTTFSFLEGMDFDNFGNIYVVDGNECKMKVYNRKGNFLKSIGGKGEGPGEMRRPLAVRITQGGEILLFDRSLSRVSKFNSDGLFISSFTESFLSSANDALVDHQGNIYMHFPREGKLIHKYDSEGKFLFSFADEIIPRVSRTRPHLNSGKIAVTSDNEIVLVLPYPYTIFIFDKNGKIVRKMVKNLPYAKPPYIYPDGRLLQTLFVIGDVSIWHRHIFVLVWTTKIGEPQTPITSYVDVFTLFGDLVAHQKIGDASTGADISPDGIYYLLELEPFPRVMAYKIKGIK